MGQSEGSIAVMVFAALLVVLLGQRWLREMVMEAIRNFRGGPPAGMHPSPADDGFLLRRRARKVED
jgi:hypothetical protein